AAVAFFFFARKLTWLISGLILLFTFWLGKLLRNTDVGLLATFFLLSTEVYWNISLEIRPDPLSSVFLLLYLITITRAAQPHRGEHERKRLFAWSGLFLAMAYLTIQKVVYAFPGLAISMCWYIFSPLDHSTRRLRLIEVGYQSVAFCAPLLLT